MKAYTECSTSPPGIVVARSHIGRLCFPNFDPKFYSSGQFHDGHGAATFVKFRGEIFMSLPWLTHAVSD